jgi:isoquinoline 1-oxidoreductase beta subunit
MVNQEALQHGRDLGAGSGAAADMKAARRRRRRPAAAVLGFLPGAGRWRWRRRRPPSPCMPNAFLHIAPDNTVTVQVNRLEFGQGVQTSCPC